MLGHLRRRRRWIDVLLFWPCRLGEGGTLPEAPSLLLDDLSDPDSELNSCSPLSTVSSPRWTRWVWAEGRESCGTIAPGACGPRGSGGCARLGFDDGAVLNGGFSAWRAVGGPMSEAPAPHAEATFHARLRPDVFVRKEKVQGALGEPTTGLVDALTARTYRGEQTPHARPAHVAGSLDGPAGRIDPLRLEALPRRRRCGPVLCGSNDRPSRPTAVRESRRPSMPLCSTAWEHGRVSVYDGSLSEWSRDPTLPMET